MTAAGLDGVQLSAEQLLDRVHDIGVFLVVRTPNDRLRDAHWATELEGRAQSRGIRLSIRDLGDVALVFELDRPGVSCDAGSGEGGDPLSPGRIASWQQHPSHGAHLRLLPGGLDPHATAPHDDDADVPADADRDRRSTREGMS